MKKFMIAVFAAAAVLFTTTGCEKSEQKVTDQLEVTANNVAGTWRLAEWSNGTLDADCYVYMKLIRKDRLFELYQNLDSFSPRKLTGEFNITTDEELGAIIRGKYDHGTGEWAHRYIVRSLTSDRMVWVAKDDTSDITVYERVASIPDDIMSAFPDSE